MAVVDNKPTYEQARALAPAIANLLNTIPRSFHNDLQEAKTFVNMLVTGKPSHDGISNDQAKKLKEEFPVIGVTSDDAKESEYGATAKEIRELYNNFMKNGRVEPTQRLDVQGETFDLRVKTGPLTMSARVGIPAHGVPREFNDLNKDLVNAITIGAQKLKDWNLDKDDLKATMMNIMMGFRSVQDNIMNGFAKDAGLDVNVYRNRKDNGGFGVLAIKHPSKPGEFLQIPITLGELSSKGLLSTHMTIAVLFGAMIATFNEDEIWGPATAQGFGVKVGGAIRHGPTALVQCAALGAVHYTMAYLKIHCSGKYKIFAEHIMAGLQYIKNQVSSNLPIAVGGGTLKQQTKDITERSIAKTLTFLSQHKELLEGVEKERCQAILETIVVNPNKGGPFVTDHPYANRDAGKPNLSVEHPFAILDK